DSNGDYIFNDQSDGKGKNIRIDDVPDTTLTVADEAVSIIYCDYNNGSPVYSFSSDNSISFFDFNIIPIIRVTRLGTQLHFEEPGEFGVQLANKLLYKNIAVLPFQRQSGLILS